MRVPACQGALESREPHRAEYPVGNARQYYRAPIQSHRFALLRVRGDNILFCGLTQLREAQLPLCASIQDLLRRITLLAQACAG